MWPHSMRKVQRCRGCTCISGPGDDGAFTILGGTNWEEIERYSNNLDVLHEPRGNGLMVN